MGKEELGRHRRARQDDRREVVAERCRGFRVQFIHRILSSSVWLEWHVGKTG